MHGMIWYDWVLLLFQVLSVSDNATMHTMEIFFDISKDKTCLCQNYSHKYKILVILT